MKLFADGNTQGIPEFGAEAVRKILLNKIGIHTFDDLIRVSGLCHGVGVWYENGEALIDAGKTLSDIVSCRDDVMLYLISHGLERKDAFEISDRIRKGKGLTEEQYAGLINEGIEIWRLDSWNKIKYSFPRAHAASYVLLAPFMNFSQNSMTLSANAVYDVNLDIVAERKIDQVCKLDTGNGRVAFGKCGGYAALTLQPRPCAVGIRFASGILRAGAAPEHDHGFLSGAFSANAEGAVGIALYNL